MSWFQTAVLVNQVATNAQLAVANARIGRLLEGYSADRDERARAAHARDLVFQVREYLEIVRQEPDVKFGYFQLLGFQQALMNAGLSPNSFTGFDEKEYARSVFQSLHATFVEMEQELGTETVQRIQYLHRLNLAVPHFAEVATWEEIEKLFPPEPWFYRFWPWVIISFLVPMHLYLIAYATVGRQNSFGIVFIGWFLQLICVLGGILIYKFRVASALPTVKQLAARYGGWATDQIKESDVRKVLQQQKSFISSFGFEVPTNNAQEAYRQRLAELGQLIGSLNFPLQLRYS